MSKLVLTAAIILLFRKVSFVDFRYEAWWWLRTKFANKVFFPLWKEPRGIDPPDYLYIPMRFLDGRYFRAHTERMALRDK